MTRYIHWQPFGLGIAAILVFAGGYKLMGPVRVIIELGMVPFLTPVLLGLILLATGLFFGFTASRVVCEIDHDAGLIRRWNGFGKWWKFRELPLEGATGITIRRESYRSRNRTRWTHRIYLEKDGTEERFTSQKIGVRPMARWIARETELPLHNEIDTEETVPGPSPETDPS